MDALDLFGPPVRFDCGWVSPVGATSCVGEIFVRVNDGNLSPMGSALAGSDETVWFPIGKDGGQYYLREFGERRFREVTGIPS